MPQINSMIFKKISTDFINNLVTSFIWQQASLEDLVLRGWES